MQALILRIASATNRRRRGSHSHDDDENDKNNSGLHRWVHRELERVEEGGEEERATMRMRGGRSGGYFFVQTVIYTFVPFPPPISLLRVNMSFYTPKSMFQNQNLRVSCAPVL